MKCIKCGECCKKLDLVDRVKISLAAKKLMHTATCAFLTVDNLCAIQNRKPRLCREWRCGVHHMIKETGTWKAIKDDKAVVIQSNDFTHDVMLTIDGDFKDLDQTLEYAKEIERRLNQHIGVKDGNFNNLRGEIRSGTLVVWEAVQSIESYLVTITSELRTIVSKYQAMEKALRKYEEDLK